MALAIWPERAASLDAVLDCIPGLRRTVLALELDGLEDRFGALMVFGISPESINPERTSSRWTKLNPRRRFAIAIQAICPHGSQGRQNLRRIAPKLGPGIAVLVHDRDP
jgi:hypothetical protein